MRTTLLVLHRWLALITALFLLVLAVTGSALVFEGAIDRGLNPALWRVQPAGAVLSLDTLMAQARAAASGDAVTGLTFARTPDRAYIAQAGGRQIFIDPFKGSILGTRAVRAFNNSLPRRLHVLHTSLMAGARGGAVVAIVTLAALVLVLTGIIVWWPDKLWRINWSASWKRIVFDLHHALGIFAALVLFVITASGLVIHYDSLGAAIARLDERPRQAPPKQSSGGGVVTIPLDSLDHIARAALPGASIMFLSLPSRGDQPFIVAMRFPEDRTPGGRSRVYVDRFNGAVLLAESTRSAPRGTRINNVMRSVHTGDLLGKPTEVVWLFAALVLGSQAVSGAIMWWNARGARAAKMRRVMATRS